MRTLTLLTIIKRRISLVKMKKLTCPLHLTDNDVIDMLWKALEFKKLYSSYHYQTNMLRKYTLIYLSAESNMKHTIPILRATKLLGMNLKVISDSTWFKDNNLEDVVLYLSNFGQIIVYAAKYHVKFQDMIDASPIPIICLQDCRYSVTDTLSDIMTFYEHFGYLKGLKFAWLGPPSSELNTFLHLAPHFDIKIAYCCSCDPDTRVSPSSLLDAKNEFVDKAIIDERINFDEAIKGSHIIATKFIESAKEKLKVELFKNAEPNWIYLRKLPRITKKDDAEIFNNSERCVTWKSSMNNVWIHMSLIMKLLKDYKNVTPEPNFKNVIGCQSSKTTKK